MALVAIGAAALIAYRWQASRQPIVCQICGRDVPKQTEFHVDTNQGTLTACCPRCAMHYMLDHPAEVRGARATAYGSGRLIDAKVAYYDEGGDLQYCTLHDPAVERGPNDGVQVRVYDRCLPVLVAFATHDEAESYRRQYGGRVLTYQQALESVREH
ncbi:MAG: hypothetical protein KGL59_08655 [Acidobacteriota bacterium]|nr:hypothetical protein [Acidobacteriota bacterium]